PFSLHWAAASTACFLRVDAAQLASTTRAWAGNRHFDDRICRALPHVRCRSLVSLAHPERSRAPGRFLPVYQWAGRRALLSRLPAGGGDTMDGLDRLGLAGQHRRLYLVSSPGEMELAQRRRRWVGGS